MFTESQPNNLPEYHKSAPKTNWRSGLRNLDRDYWAIVDEIKLEAVREQIDSIITPAISISPPPIFNIEDASFLMVNDLKRTIRGKQLKNLESILINLSS